MSETDDAILKYLEHAIRRDAEKGGPDGWRSSSEVYEHLGGKRAHIWRRLNELQEAGSVDVADPIDGGGFLWRWTGNNT